MNIMELDNALVGNLFPYKISIRIKFLSLLNLIS